MVASDTAANDPSFTAQRALRRGGWPRRASGRSQRRCCSSFRPRLAQPQYVPGPRTLDQIRAEQLEARNRQQQLENRPPEIEKIFAATEGKPADARPPQGRAEQPRR